MGKLSENETQILKLCENNTEYADLCPCLSGQNGLRVNHILSKITNDLDPSILDRFILCSEKYCGGDPLASLFNYFKMFREIPSFKIFINNSDLSVSLLENYIIHLMGFCHEIGQSREDFFDSYLSCLTQNTYVRLLRNAKYLYRDVDFFVYSLIKLDTEHVGLLTENSPHIQQVLTDIVLNFPEDRIRKILSRNPNIYEYCIKYLEHDSKTEEAAMFRNKYNDVIALADKIMKASEYIRSAEKDTDRGHRIELIVSKIRETKNPDETLSVLDYNNVFKDEFEQQIVHRFFSDAAFSALFNLHLTGYMKQE